MIDLSMQNCLFCKIVAGELPCYKVYEDGLFFGFLDVRPRSKGHTLFIPKKHYRWVYEIDAFEKYWAVALLITKAIKKALRPFFITYVTHGLEVDHAHLHIIPRSRAQTQYVPDVVSFSNKELKKTAEIIRSAF